MATRILSGWTPGSPIDGQIIRVYAGGALAGTYPLANDATSCEVELGPGLNKAELRSLFEAEQSDVWLVVEYTAGGERGSESGESGGNPEIPGPTGTISVSNP